MRSANAIHLACIWNRRCIMPRKTIEQVPVVLQRVLTSSLFSRHRLSQASESSGGNLAACAPTWLILSLLCTSNSFFTFGNFLDCYSQHQYQISMINKPRRCLDLWTDSCTNYSPQLPILTFHLGILVFAVISLLVLWRSGTLCSLMTAKITHDRGLKTGHPVIQSCCQGSEGETAAEYFHICGVTPEKEGVFLTQTGFVSAHQ